MLPTERRGEIPCPSTPNKIKKGFSEDIYSHDLM